MKTSVRIISVLLVTFLFACSNKETSNNSEQQSSPSPSDLMKEEPPYDATKIDPNAKVTEIILHAQGNSMTEMKFDLAEINVPEGSTVKIKFINEATDAAMIHNFLLIEEGSADKVAAAGITAGPDKNYIPDLKEVLYGTKVVNPKEEIEFTIPAPAKGTYDFICTYPGHYKMMHGKFIVS